MPVLFLLHHFVELELKEIIRLSSCLCEREGKPNQKLPEHGDHSIIRLLDISENNLKEISPDEMPLLDEKSKGIVEDLEEFGSKGEGLRYPETIPKYGSDPTISPSYVANVRAVMTVMTQMRSRFNGCIGWLDDRCYS